ncbi:hypothetical protein J8350_19045, partial [Escherichia coli]|uniref:hypothetical protein n=1 Tax=Escherichia coli TaxID=562 RepID=UPI001AEC8E1A
PKTSIICSPMTSLKTSIKTITYLSDIGCLEIQGASLALFGRLFLCCWSELKTIKNAPSLARYGGSIGNEKSAHSGRSILFV